LEKRCKSSRCLKRRRLLLVPISWLVIPARMPKVLKRAFI